MSRILHVDFRDHLKQYRGWREGHAVLVTVNDQPLNLRLEVCNHSPTGFEWGYHGSGPAQLALALLIEHLEDTDQALALHQSFKQQVIAHLPFGGWTLTTTAIEEALHSLPFPVVTYAVRIRR